MLKVIWDPQADHEEVLAIHNNTPLLRRSLKTLMDQRWLDDEIINHFLARVQQRLQDAGVLDVHIFSTLFYQALTGRGYKYSAVRRWTRHLSQDACLLVNKRLLIFPLHVGGNHWAFAVLHVPIMYLEYFDSGRSTLPQHLCEPLGRWVADECMDKRGVPFMMRVQYGMAVTAKQQNGFDCGMFTVLLAARTAAGSSIQDVQQRSMPYFRRRMACELSAHLHQQFNFESRFAQLAFNLHFDDQTQPGDGDEPGGGGGDDDDEPGGGGGGGGEPGGGGDDNPDGDDDEPAGDGGEPAGDGGDEPSGGCDQPGGQDGGGEPGSEYYAALPLASQPMDEELASTPFYKVASRLPGGASSNIDALLEYLDLMWDTDKESTGPVGLPLITHPTTGFLLSPFHEYPETLEEHDNVVQTRNSIRVTGNKYLQAARNHLPGFQGLEVTCYHYRLYVSHTHKPCSYLTVHRLLP